MQPPTDTRPVEEMRVQPRATLDGPERASTKSIPTLKTITAGQLEAKWMALKKMRPIAKQIPVLEKRGLQQFMATDLQPITSLEAFENTFRRRDHYRERIYGGPEMIAVLQRASDLIEKRRPGTLITVGDVAQPGGGQIPYGARVEFLEDGVLRTPASNFLRLSGNDYDGTPIEHRLVDGTTTYPDERHRFEEYNDPILVERRLLGASSSEGKHKVRLATRRFWLANPLKGQEMSNWWFKKKRSLIPRHRLDQTKLSYQGKPLWRSRYLVRGQWTEIFTLSRPRQLPNLWDVVEIRMGSMDPKKPGVLIRERRYLAQRPEGKLRSFDVRVQFYEASHITHLSGRDADISYITVTPDSHFSRKIREIDPAATRLWLKTLYEAATDVGVQVEAMLVDPKVRRLLQKGISEKEATEPYWKVIKLAKGHDSHVHLRLHRGFRGVTGR